MLHFKHLLGLPVAVCLVAGMMLGALAVAPGPVAAATTPTVALTPTTVPLGGHVAVSAANFAANETVNVTLSQYPGRLATLKANSSGIVPLTNVTIPATFKMSGATKALSPGAHTLTLSGATSARSVSVQLTLMSSVSVSVSSIVLGGKVAVSGAGFSANETVNVTLSQYNGTLATLKADNNGIVPLTDVTIPTTFKVGTATQALSPGTHTLTLSGVTSHRTASAQLTLTPTSSLSVTSVPLGGQVAVSGAGFTANATVNVTLSQYPGTLATLKADNNGIVALTNVTIPTTFQVNGMTKALSPGAHTLTLSGASNGRTVTMQLSLVSAVTLSSSTLSLGGQVAVSGAGFSANETVIVTLTQYSGTLATLKANNNGIVPLTDVMIPTTLSAGAHTISLTGETSHRSASIPVTVGSTVPATTLAVTPATTNRGGLITVSGSNFAPNEAVTVMIAGLSTPLATLTATAQGQIAPAGVTIPYSVMVGSHTLQLTGVTSKHMATENITVAALKPSITARTTMVSAGTKVTVTGTGFGRQEQVTLSLNGAALPTTPAVITTTNGSFTASFTAPAGLLRGANALSAVGSESRVSASANLPGVTSAAATLYFAGASTMAGNQANLAILNASAQPAHIALTFYYGNSTGTAGLTVAAHSRGTANLNAMAGRNQVFGLKLTADQSVTAQLNVIRSGKDSYGLLGVAAPNTAWYLAEGYTGRGFHETLALLNPGSVASQVQLHLLPASGHDSRLAVVSVAPHSTQIVDVNSLMPRQSVSVIAQASQPIVLERTIAFGAHDYGITAKMGANAPATSWVFAQGSFSARVQSYLSVLNPNTSATSVTASFYGPNGAALGSRTVYVPALRRTTIKISAAATSIHNVSSVVTSDLPVVVERPMYTHIPRSSRTVESDVFGRNGAGLSWSFPGGVNLSRDDVLYVFNPSATAATITATFYGSNGMVVSKSMTVAPTGQRVVDVNALVPGLTARHSAVLRSTNGVGFIAAQTITAPNFTALQSTQGFAS